VVIYGFFTTFSGLVSCGSFHDYQDFEITELVIKFSRIRYSLKYSFDKIIHRVEFPIAPRYLEIRKCKRGFQGFDRNLLEQKEIRFDWRTKVFHDAAEG